MIIGSVTEKRLQLSVFEFAVVSDPHPPFISLLLLITIVRKLVSESRDSDLSADQHLPGLHLLSSPHIKCVCSKVLR